MADELSRGEIVTVLETGSYTTKLGYADSQSGPSVVKTKYDWMAQDKKYPVEQGSICDYDALAEYWTGLMTAGVFLRRSLNETPLLLNLSMAQYSRSSIERIAQIVFENLEIPACYMAAQPLMSLYACGVVNGLVVDMGHQSTSITPVLDSNIQYHSAAMLPVGGEDVTQALWETHLSSLESPLRKPFEALFPSGLDNLSRASMMKEFISLKCASIAQSPKSSSALLHDTTLSAEPVAATVVSLVDSAPTQASPLTGSGSGSGAESESTSLSPKALEAGTEALKTSMEILFQSPANGYRLGDQVFGCLRGLESEKQQLLLDHVVLTGGSSLWPGAQSRLESELRAHLTVSDFASDSQPKSIRFIRIPDYFTEIKGRNEHASWFGGSIVAKLVFADPKNFLSRADYNEHGPKIAWEKPY